MSIRKIIIYQRYATKPVILTDASDTPEKIKDQILQIMSSDKISVLETQNDILVIRPSEVQSILITNTNPESMQNDPILDGPDSSRSVKGFTPNSKPYLNKLSMEKK